MEEGRRKMFNFNPFDWIDKYLKIGETRTWRNAQLAPSSRKSSSSCHEKWFFSLTECRRFCGTCQNVSASVRNIYSTLRQTLGEPREASRSVLDFVQQHSLRFFTARCGTRVVPARLMMRVVMRESVEHDEGRVPSNNNRNTKYNTSLY